MIDPLVYASILISMITILASLSLTLTYLTTKVPNFAQGSFLTLGAFVGIYSQEVLKITPYYFLPFAFLLVGLYSFTFYKLVIKPLINRKASIVILMIATLTLSIFSFSFINIIASWLTRTYKGIAVTYVNFKKNDFLIFDIPSSFIFSILAVIIISISLYLLLTKTKFGIAMRAAIENPYLASVVGINIDRVYSFSWFLSGALTGIAGIFYGFYYSITTASGDQFLPYIFAASILGGLRNIFGAIPGGLIIGVSSIGITYLLVKLGYEFFIVFQPVIPLVIMSITLLVFPQGITGINYSMFLQKFINIKNMILKSK